MGADTTPSIWDAPAAPADAILALNTAFAADTAAVRVNLGVGAYRDAEGLPCELAVVREARGVVEEEGSDHQYLGIEGLRELRDGVARLVFGDAVVDAGRVVCVQTLGGSGALSVAVSFLKGLWARGEEKDVWVCEPTWPNHEALVAAAGLRMRRYRYYDRCAKDVNADWMVADLGRASRGDVVVLHACAHNPTGADLDAAAWKRVADVVCERGLVPLFDMAYQGFASGDVERDVAAVRMFAARGLHVLVAQSFSKNLGLYNSRVGALCIAIPPHDTAAAEAERILSRLKWTIRPMYSTPPAHGARIASLIINDASRAAQWRDELRAMVARTARMRHDLHAALVARRVPGNWDHVLRASGMFVFLGISEEQVARMRTLHHVYMTANARINASGLTVATIPVLVEALAEVLCRDPLREVSPNAITMVPLLAESK